MKQHFYHWYRPGRLKDVVQHYMNYSNLKKIADIAYFRYIKFLQWSWFALKYKILIPFAKFIIQFLSNRLSNETLTLTNCEWKEAVLADFKTWLADLPDTTVNEQETTPESCDLYTLLSEFSALRQEIKIQNREQNKGIKTIETIINSYDKSRQVIKEMTDELYDFKEKTLLTLKEKDIMIQRPAGGIRKRHYQTILGSVSKKSFTLGDALEWNSLILK